MLIFSMPKVRPIESEAYKRQVFIVKIFFLGLVILLTLFMNFYLTNRPLSPPPMPNDRQATKKDNLIAKNIPSILGAQTQEELVASLQKELKNIQNKLEDILGSVQQQGGAVIEETSENARETAVETIFDAAVIPVITQIQNLPERQQEQIKEAICR